MGRSWRQRLVGLAAGVACGCSSYAPDPMVVEVPLAEGDAAALRAPHRRDGRFYIPWAHDPRSNLAALRWFLLTRNPYEKGGAAPAPVVPNDGRTLSETEPGTTFTWIGHASFAVHEGDRVFLTDPHFGPRALVPHREVPPGVPPEAIPGDAFALISHNHYDHLDEWTVERLPETVHWFVPLGLAEWFRARGRTVTELDWWQSARHGNDTITCLPSQHWSRRIGSGENRTLWCSWLIDSGRTRVYFAGDTGYFGGFREFGRVYGEIDVALLPIGAYEPRWFMKFQHMNPAEAYQAFLDLGARALLPMHWGTFDLTDEPLDLPPRELARVGGERGGDPERVPRLAVGERWRLPERPR